MSNIAYCFLFPLPFFSLPNNNSDNPHGKFLQNNVILHCPNKTRDSSIDLGFKSIKSLGDKEQFIHN